MHFRSFAPFMALAFAASAIAAPFASTRDLTSPGKSAASSVSGVAKELENPVGDLLSRQEQQVPLHVIFQKASDRIQPMVVLLKNNAQDQAQIDEVVLTQNLQAIKTALTELHAEVTTFAEYPVSVIESLAIVPAVVAALTPLLQLLVSVLATVATLVLATPVGTVVLPLILSIVALVGTILAIIVGVVPQLLNALLPFLNTLLPSLSVLNITSIPALLAA